jgi:hypothetical protein
MHFFDTFVKQIVHAWLAWIYGEQTQTVVTRSECIENIMISALLACPYLYVDICNGHAW